MNTTIGSCRFAQHLLVRAQGIKVAFFDVDGVLTDGGLYISANGEEFKRFHTLDGHGLKLIRRAGIEPVVITGRDSAALRHRLQALGLERAVYGTEDKWPAAQKVLDSLGLDWSQAAAIGDDWPDLPVLMRAQLAIAPPHAHPEVLAAAHGVTVAGGGQGAAREFCDLLLMAQGAYRALLDEVTAPLGAAGNGK